MNLQEPLDSLITYHFDTTLRLLDLAQGVGEGFALPLHALFLHILESDRRRRAGLAGTTLPAPTPDDYPDLAALRAAFTAERQDWLDLFAGLSGEELAAEVEFVRRGETLRYPRWKVLAHVLLHGMQHHAELAERLTSLGRSPGNIDFILYR